MVSIDTVITMLNSLFSKTNTDNISRSVAHIAGSFENLEKTTITLDELMTEEKKQGRKDTRECGVNYTEPQKQ